MKPTKNRVMCPDCRKPKMLFETERKALDHIKWNSEGMEYGADSMRAYYCPSCCGWHITHKRHKDSYDHHTEELISDYKKSVSAGKRMKIDRILNRQYDIKDAERIFGLIPEEALVSKKKVRGWLTQYFMETGTDERQCGQLRCEIYKIWGSYTYKKGGANEKR